MFVRNIFSDGMLSAIICIPLLLAATYRFVFPLIVQHYPVLKDFSLYHPILDLFLAIMCPYMICFASVLVVLDETDMKINRYITITPLGKKGYLISRLIIPVLFAAVVSFVLLSFCSVSDMSLWTTFIISILATILSVVYNPQNEMFRLLGTKRSFSQNETFFFSHPYPALFRLISHF